jgi:hypothetical protein
MTFTAQTGYRRSHPRGICQNHDFLLAVTQFDFDLFDPDFVAYFEGRTGIQLRSTGGYFTPRNRSVEEWDEMVADLSSAEDETTRILRGKLQDCWELYNKPASDQEPKFERVVCFQNVKRERLMLDEVITASPGYVCPPW